MGIIHTARKNIVNELVRKKSLLQREIIAAREGRERELTLKELTEVSFYLPVHICKTKKRAIEKNFEIRKKKFLVHC